MKKETVVSVFFKLFYTRASFRNDSRHTTIKGSVFVFVPIVVSWLHFF